MKTLLLLAMMTLALSASAQVVVTIDSNTRYQTIHGWGHGGGVFSNLNYALRATDQSAADSLNCQYIDYVVHELGLTGSRMWEVGPRLDGTGIDVNGDCDSLDWSRCETSANDSAIGAYARYFRSLVEADGCKTSFYSSPTYPTFATAFKPWVLNHPGERALQIWANALWWKRQGIDIDYAVIQNEPSGSWSPQVIADDIAALGPRLQAHALSTKAQFGEGVDPHTSWIYDTSIHPDSRWWSYVGRLSYHRYGTDDPYRSYLADSAAAHNLSTAQTEMYNPSLLDAFSDLTVGNVIYWEVGFSGSFTLANTPGGTNWIPTPKFFQLRQLLHYVRPGDTRIGATSSDSSMSVVSFWGRRGITTVLYDQQAARAVTVRGLAPGRYGISQVTAGQSAFQEVGVRRVGSDGILQVSIAGAGTALTIYPEPPGNTSPTIQTWSANPAYVVAPASSVMVSVTASDAELDPLGYSWSVVRQPGGAHVGFAEPASKNTAISGLSEPGLYVFAVTVSDGALSSTRDLYVMVYDSLPAPTLWQSGFRFARPYGLVFGDPESITRANVELPTTSATLQVGISDLANSDFSGRGKWSVVSEPAGAHARVDSTVYIYLSIRAQVTNMTVPGDYLFECRVTNPGAADLVDRILCTVHPASSGPSITSIAATTASWDSVVRLSAEVIDTSLQQLRYWWFVKSSPKNTDLSFEHQGRQNTLVTGLSLPGEYVFTLNAFDDVHQTSRDVAVYVSSANVLTPTATTPASIIVSPNPAKSHCDVHYTLKYASEVRLSVSDIGGSERLLLNDNETQGAHDHSIDLSALPAGTYYVHLRTNRETVTAPLILLP